MSAIPWPPAFFITGTDTDVGKSVVSAILTLDLGATYWKPIQAGLKPYTDTEFVHQVTGLDHSHFFPERFRLTQPLSPHTAAAIDGIEIQLSDFSLPTRPLAPGSDRSADPSAPSAPSGAIATTLYKPHLIVEGAGGLRVPINPEQYMTDLIQHLGLPVLLVARSGLGTINHTILSIECLRHRGIPLLGVVLNGPRNEGNRRAIAHYGKTSILAEIEPLSSLNPTTLQAAWQSFD
ncbi:MAG: AAA family ATPase [Synechococcales cyanobacterium CRU_2_2]|nr:AAA family ATPase [Synechococcales cyanobacterium CRU_2_2]